MMTHVEALYCLQAAGRHKKKLFVLWVLPPLARDDVVPRDARDALQGTLEP